MNFKQILLVLTSIVVFILFWISTDDAFNTNSQFKTLSESEDTYVFKTADITFYSCKTAYIGNDCEKVHSILKAKLADWSYSALISGEVLEASTHAVFEYVISETIRKVYNKLDSISYVSVNTAQLQSVIRTNISRKHYHRGFGANLDQIFFKSTLDKSDFLVHEVYFGDLDAFGPQTFPPILTSPQNLRKISQLIPSLAFSSALAKQIEVALALIIGLLLLVFDHSKSFRYLGLFAIFKALTNYLSAVLDFGYQSEYVDSVVCIIQIFTFLYAFYAWQFLHSIFRYESPNFKIETLVICSSLITIAPTLLFFFFRYVFWIYVDVILGLLILAYTLHFCLNQYKLNKLKFKHWSRNVNYYSMGVLLFAALTLLASSYEGLIAFHFFGTPDLLDFKITLVVPLFMMASLIDIGSVVKYTELLKLDVATKTALEKELILGQELQRELLPDKRGNGDFYSWRTLFKPAVYVSGDWHDVGIIKFKGGETLLAGAIVDITGHGVRAAIMSNNVATHYLEWKDMCQYSNCPESDQGLRNLVEECIFKVNYSLFVQKYKVGAAMTMFVMTSEGKLVVSCQGQSGLVLFDMDYNFTRYIATSGGRLGSTIESLNIATEFTSFDENESGFYFFTDGILSEGQTMGRFLSRLRGKSAKDEPVSTIINRSIRKSRKLLSLKSQGMHDDLTLIKINFKS